MAEYIKKTDIIKKIQDTWYTSLPNKYKLKVLELIEACVSTDIPTEPPVVLNFIADTQQINELMNKIAQQDKVQLINRVSDKNLL